jgi:hypothetical protein
LEKLKEKTQNFSQRLQIHLAIWENDVGDNNYNAAENHETKIVPGDTPASDNHAQHVRISPLKKVLKSTLKFLRIRWPKCLSLMSHFLSHYKITLHRFFVPDYRYDKNPMFTAIDIHLRQLTSDDFTTLFERITTVPRMSGWKKNRLCWPYMLNVPIWSL